MSNDPDLMDKLNKAVRKADQAIRASAQGRPDPESQADAVNRLSETIQQLDSRILSLEEKLKERD